MIRKPMMMVAALAATFGAWAETWTDPDTGYTWTYRINGDNTVSIYNDYSAAISPNPTGVVTIPSTLGGKGVTSIGDYAFRDCSGLTSVTIPDSVTSIGDAAFIGCCGLTSVTIPDSVTSIGDSAFWCCSGLTSVTIGKGVTSIGEWPFYCCNGITSVTIPQCLCSYRFKTIFSDSYRSIKNVIISDSVTSIGDNAFALCSGLTSVTIPDTVSIIGNYAFSNCGQLKSVIIPYGVASIGSVVFYKCLGLTSVTIPDSVTYIGGEAFYGCSNLASVTIPDSVTDIGYGAFCGCSGLTRVTIGDSVTSINDSLFSGCNLLTAFVVGNGNQSFKSASGLLLTKDARTLVAVPNGLKSVTIPDSVTSIGDSAFSGCSGLTNVTIPDSVTSIGSYAFSGCSGLASVTIPDSVTSIGSYAFSNSSELKSVTISNGVTSIGEGVFRDCSGLTSMTIPDSVTSIGSYAFSGCSGLTSVTIPDSVTSIGSYAFSDCSVLKGVTISNGVTSIGEGAFRDCSGLTGVHITDLAKWCGISFDGYDDNPLYYAHNLYLNGEKMVDLVIPDGVTNIGEYAFSGCSGFASVTIPDSVTSIGSSAFSGCSDSLFDTTTIPGVKLVDGWAVGNAGTISGSLSLTGLRGIGDSAFLGCSGLTSVTIGNGVTIIGKRAFYDCGGLASVTIPNSVTSIGHDAFYGCSYSLFDTTTISGVKLVDDWAIENADYLYGGLNLTGVRGIGERAFSGCSGLTNVTIPDGVTSIGYGAFDDCTGLEYITIPYLLADDLEAAFPNGLGNVEIVFFMTTGGGTGWEFDRETVYGGIVSRRSGAIGNDQESWIEMKTQRPGRLSFWWKASCESDGDCVYDYAYLSIDGEPKGTLLTANEEYQLEGVSIGGKTDWQQVVLNVTGEGPHTIRWTYCKDEVDEGDIGEDCVWLDDVEFTPLVSVTFDLGGGMGAAPASFAEMAGTVVTMPDQSGFDLADYVFDGWSDGTTTYASGASYTMPSEDVTLTAQWIKKTFLAFDLGGGTGTAPEVVKELRGTVVTLPDQSGFDRTDHVFNGWSDGTDTYSAGASYTMPSEDVTLTAQWIEKRFLTFTIDGGEGTVPVTIKDIPGAVVTLPTAEGFSKPKHTFVGWSDGSATYGAGDSYTVGDGGVEFTAVWQRNELSVSISSGDVVNGGTNDTQSTTISMDAWSNPSGGTPTIYYTLDGSEPTTNSTRYVEPFFADDLGDVTVKAIAVMDNYFDSDVVTFTFTRLPYSAAECIGVTDESVATGGDAEWSRVLGEEAHDGVAAMRSGAIGDSQSSYVEMQVERGGEISFWWKISSQNKVRTNKHDYLAFAVDGEIVATLGGGAIDWTNETYSVECNESHTLRWTYFKDGDGNVANDDCAWLDEVVWMPAQLRHFTVAFDANGGSVGETEREVTDGDQIGELPLPTRDGYTFVGWFTAADDGDEVIADTIVTDEATFYAQWVVIPLAVGDAVTWNNTGTNNAVWDDDAINESNLDFMIPATDRLPAGAKVRIKKIIFASLNTAFTEWDAMTNKSDPYYVRLSGVNSEQYDWGGTIESCVGKFDNAVTYTYDKPCYITVGKKYSAVSGNDIGGIGNGIAFLHSNGKLLYGANADRASVRYVNSGDRDSIMSTTSAATGYYPVYEIEAEVVALESSALDELALDYTATLENDTITKIDGGWFNGATAFDDGSRLSSSDLRIGPDAGTGYVLQTTSSATPYKNVAARTSPFSFALYADVSAMPAGGKAIILEFGNNGSDMTIMFREGDEVKLGFGNKDGIIGTTASVAVRPGYHLYTAVCNPETGDSRLRLDGGSESAGSAGRQVSLGNGFQIASVYYGIGSTVYSTGANLAIAKLLGYQAEFAEKDIAALAALYPAVESVVCDVAQSGLNGKSLMVAVGQTAKLIVTAEQNRDGFKPANIVVKEGGSLVFVAPDGTEIDESRVAKNGEVWELIAQPQIGVQAGENTVTGADGSYIVTGVDGKNLSADEISVYAIFDGEVVETTDAYIIEVIGNSATVKLKAPEIAVAAEQSDEVLLDDDDPAGVLVVVDDSSKVKAKPVVGINEEIGAIPVKGAVKGLWYRASWGADLQHLVDGESFQANGGQLYLGVIKQNGSSGFYKLSVSEK